MRVHSASSRASVSRLSGTGPSWNSARIFSAYCFHSSWASSKLPAATAWRICRGRSSDEGFRTSISASECVIRLRRNLLRLEHLVDVAVLLLHSRDKRIRRGHLLLQGSLQLRHLVLLVGDCGIKASNLVLDIVFGGLQNAG